VITVPSLWADHRKEVLEIKDNGGHWWLTPVILATQEAEIRRISEASLGK
jgi:hypothetical protein